MFATVAEFSLPGHRSVPANGSMRRHQSYLMGTSRLRFQAKTPGHREHVTAVSTRCRDWSNWSDCGTTMGWRHLATASVVDLGLRPFGSPNDLSYTFYANHRAGVKRSEKARRLNGRKCELRSCGSKSSVVSMQFGSHGGPSIKQPKTKQHFAIAEWLNRQVFRQSTCQ